MIVGHGKGLCLIDYGKRLSEYNARNQGVTAVRDWSGYERDPVGFCRHALNIKVITPDQIRILESLRDNRETNVPSHHGAGKTMIAAAAILWQVFAVRGLCVSTAPTFTQLKDVLWSEVRQLYDSNCEILGGTRLEMSIRLTESARAYGFATRNYDSNSFQGRHAAKLLLIEDEACGISRTIDDAAEACLTGSQNKLLRIGNPIASGTPFEDACKRSQLHLPAWDHPNIDWAYQVDHDGIHRLKPEIARVVLDAKGNILPRHRWREDLPEDVIPGAISVEWIERVRHTKGENSAYWVSRIEAQFPSDAESSLIPRSWFLEARQRYDENPDKYAPNNDWIYGLDVGDGSDPHAIAGISNRCLQLVGLKKTKGDRLDINRAADWAIEYLEKHPGQITVDEIGVGSGALSILISECTEALQNNPESPLSQSWATGTRWSKPARRKRDRRKFANLKVQQHLELRDAFVDGSIAIAPLSSRDDIEDLEEMLMEELSAIRYIEINNKMGIEKKDIARKNLGRSPNIADAFVMAYGLRHDGGVSVSNL